MRTEFLRPIDGLRLSEEYRALLRPGENEADANGTIHRLPRFFYEIGSWEDAHEIRLAPHFTLAELMLVDCREARLLLSQFPHYVPCAIVLLARFLEDFRREVDAPVFISANGGYRSPAHEMGAQKAFMRGVQRQISTGLAILSCATRSLLRNIGRSQRRLAQLFLFGHSDVKKDRPATTSTSI